MNSIVGNKLSFWISTNHLIILPADRITKISFGMFIVDNKNVALPAKGLTLMNYGLFIIKGDFLLFLSVCRYSNAVTSQFTYVK